MRIAGELHDVGKVAIPDAILNKPGPLDDTSGSSFAATPRSASASSPPPPRWPRSRRSYAPPTSAGTAAATPTDWPRDEIPLGARIVAVCDAYDAMITERPYQRAMDPAPALEELRRCAGTQFDPDVVDAFGLVLLDRPAPVEHEAV